MKKGNFVVVLASMMIFFTSCQGAVNPTLRAAALERHKLKHEWKTQMGVRVYLDSHVLSPESLSSGEVKATVDYCICGTTLAGTRIEESWSIHRGDQIIGVPDIKVFNGRREEVYSTSNSVAIPAGTPAGEYEFVCTVSATHSNSSITVKLPFTVTN